MKHNSFDAILFDFGNVIIDIDFEILFEGFANASGKSVDAVKTRLSDHQVFRRYESGYFDNAEFFEVIRQTIGFPFNNGEIERIWNSMLLQIPPNRIELVRYLNTKFPVFLLSNTNPIHINWCNNYLEEKYAIASVNALFKKAYLSYELGMWKPDEVIYKHVLDDAGFEPEQVIFFDDNLDNVISAQNLGMQCVQITPEYGILDFFKEERS